LSNAVRPLQELQRIDLAISAIEDEGRVFRRAMDDLASEISRERQAQVEVSAEAEGLKGQMRALDEKTAQCLERVGRNEKRVNEVKNDRELHAITKEISSATKEKKLAEQEKTSLQARLDEIVGRISEAGSMLAEKEGRLGNLSEELGPKKAAWDQAVAEKQALRQALMASIEPSLLKRYETIRSKRAGLGVVEAKDGACRGCNIHIPPQIYIQLKRGVDELITCPHCHRILYAETQPQPEGV
jgi:predicted  nucleic acid-binding Zn-ribbon protein